MDESRQDGCIVVGVLSDTHGQLQPRVLKSLEGVDHIIHAGDVGSAQVLNILRAMAPVTAVRGNCDLDAWAEPLPERAEVTLGGARILVSHVGARVRPSHASGRPQADGDIAVAVFGHSHVASVEEHDRILYVNPGSAGPRRFGRQRTLARLEIVPASTYGPQPGLSARPRISATIVFAED